MDVFRIKKTRDTTKHDVVIGTLDHVHHSIISNIKECTVNLQELSIRATEIEKELQGMKNFSDTSQCVRSTKLKEELTGIQDRLKTADPLKDYYLQNADIILEYYTSNDKCQQLTYTPADQNTFVKYLAPTNTDTGISKKQLFEEYASRMKLHIGNVEQRQVITEHCHTCNIARQEVSDEGILVCPSCGSEEYLLIVSDFPSFRDPPKERNNYAYKKINHLNEILSQFQAKESTIIPDEVMNEVVLEVKKRRISNIAELVEKDIREILKKLNRSKYYEHAAHIVSRLNGNPPPTITPPIEEKIRTMFQEIQAPFLLYCPDDRTNFLSYSYILFKFFELLELETYKSFFPLLKSRDRLIAHDEIWKKICEYLQWEFVSSV